MPPGEVLLDLAETGDASRFWEAVHGRGAALLADFGAMLANWQKLAAERAPARPV